MSNVRFNIDEDTGVDHCDEGGWRSYHLTGHGSTASELYRSLAISEIDQDGGEIDTYDLAEAREDVTEAAMDIYTRTLLDSFRNNHSLLHPDTGRLTIKAKFELEVTQPKDLHEALLFWFKSGYGPLSEAEVKATQLYLAKLELRKP